MWKRIRAPGGPPPSGARAPSRRRWAVAFRQVGCCLSAGGLLPFGRWAVRFRQVGCSLSAGGQGLRVSLVATRASGGIGRRARFRSVCPKGCGGSTPPSRTPCSSQSRRSEQFPACGQSHSSGVGGARRKRRASPSMPRAVSVRQPATRAAMPQPGPKIRPTTRANAMTPASTNQKTGRGWICTMRRYAPAGRPQCGNRWGLRQHKRRGAWEPPRTLTPKALASFRMRNPSAAGPGRSGGRSPGLEFVVPFSCKPSLCKPTYAEQARPVHVRL
jgi:hypothetical protein